MLSTKENLRIEELVGTLNVSEATVRRTLSELEKDGKVIRTHGGVQLFTRRSHDYLFDNKFSKNLEQKRAIGLHASKMVNSNEVIFLDSGTTVYVMAEYLTRRLEAEQIRGIRVVTNSIAIAENLGTLCEVIILGGRVRPRRRDISGPIVEKNIQMFRANKAFIGTDGITIRDGLMTTDEYTSKIDEEMTNRSDQVILLADSSKFNTPSFVSYAGIESIDIIVTDSRIKNEVIRAYQKFNIQILLAPVEDEPPHNDENNIHSS